MEGLEPARGSASVDPPELMEGFLPRLASRACASRHSTSGAGPLESMKYEVQVERYLVPGTNQIGGWAACGCGRQLSRASPSEALCRMGDGGTWPVGRAGW